LNHRGFVTPTLEENLERLSKSHVEKCMNRLIDALLVTNTTIFQEFFSKLFTAQELFISNKKLNDWVMIEIFSPRSQIPVFGFIQEANIASGY
jgi:hypothetical protein